MITWSDRLELELSILLLGEEGEVEESLLELVASLTDLGPLSAILGTVTMSLSHCCSLVLSHFCKEDVYEGSKGESDVANVRISSITTSAC